MGIDPHDGTIQPLPNTGDEVASRKVGARIVAVRRGNFDGVEVRFKNGRSLNHRQTSWVGCEGNHCARVIVSDPGFLQTEDKEIGVALENAVCRALEDGNLSPKEAKQLARASQMISRALKNQSFDYLETPRIVAALNKVAKGQEPASGSFIL